MMTMSIVEGSISPAMTTEAVTVTKALGVVMEAIVTMSWRSGQVVSEGVVGTEAGQVV